MPYSARKKYYRRKRYYKRARRFYKRNKMIPRSPTTGYLYIKQKSFDDVAVPAITVPGTIQCYMKTFQLSDMTQNWGAVFDQFRIVGCKVTFWNTNLLAGSALNNPVVLYTSIDLDGQSALPTLEDDLLQRSNVKQRILSASGGNPQYHTHYVRPRTSKAIYSGGVLSAYGLDPKKTWLDIRSSISAPHYGLMWAISAPSPMGNPIDIRVQTTYYLQFRKVI